MKVLLLEDDEILNEMISAKLKQKGYEVYTAFDGDEAQSAICEESFDLMLFDVNVPYMNGFELLKELRKDGIKIPTIYITSLDDIKSQEKGFEAGCIDYIKKPFSFEELNLRIENVKRIFNLDSHALFTLSKECSYDYEKGIVTIKEKKVVLSKVEKRVFEYFLKNIDRTVSLDELGLNIWSYDERPTDSTIRTYIKNFRKLLGKEYIETFKGVGYRFNTI